MTLQDLAVKYSSDKLYRHSYIEHLYPKLFEPFRDKPINLFEFGIGNRALMAPFVPEFTEHSSIKIWLGYFPLANIYAADHQEAVLLNEGRVKSFLCEQSSYDSLVELRSKLPDLDIIIEDGSHLLEHQVLTVSVLEKKLKSPGVLIIEDVYPDSGAQLANLFGGTLYEFGKTADDNAVVVLR